MVVPGPAGGEHEIARPHRDAFAFDRRVGAFAFDDEAKRVGRMPVGPRDFAPAAQDLTQGRLQVAATGVPLLVPHHRAGTASLLFVTTKERSPQAPEVPTAREAGYPDLTFEGTVGIYGWRDMPADIRNRISTDVQAITAEPAFRERVMTAGSAARTGTSAEFAAAIAEQRDKIAAIHKTIAKPAR